MVDVLPVILKFWAILKSRFSKVRQSFSNFLRFYSLFGGFLLKQNNDWQLLLLESSKRLKSRQFALPDLLISCQFYAVGYMYML